MISKVQRRSSRSYKERQSLARLHQAKTPQIYKKEMPKAQSRHKTTTNRGLSWWERLKDWLRKLIGGK